MDYRQAVEQAQELFDSVANTKRLADALFEAYETGKSEREPPTPDAQGYLHVTEACYAALQDDRRRMDYIRKTSRDATDGMYTPLPGAPVLGSIEKRLDAAIKEEVGQS